MDHVRPDFQSDCNIRRACRGCEANGIVKQGLGRTHLNQRWWKIPKIGIERRKKRVFPVYFIWEIRVRQFIQILLVDQWICGVFACPPCVRYQTLRFLHLARFVIVHIRSLREKLYSA